MRISRKGVPQEKRMQRTEERIVCSRKFSLYLLNHHYFTERLFLTKDGLAPLGSKFFANNLAKTNLQEHRN